MLFQWMGHSVNVSYEINDFTLRQILVRIGVYLWLVARVGSVRVTSSKMTLLAVSDLQCGELSMFFAAVFTSLH